MPRLKPTDQEEANRIIRSCIAANMERQAMTNDQLAVKLGMVTRTFQNKRKSPETFTASELYRLSKILKFTPVQAASMMLGRDLTSAELKEFILM